MATSKQRRTTKPLTKPLVFDSRHHAGKFDLGFLQPQEPPVSYENELLTAEEKAAYYEDLIQNNGFENSEKIAKDCMKKAGALMKKVDFLDEDEALPLREKIVGLVALANNYKNAVPPDVLASQTVYDDAVPSFPLTPKIKNSLADFKPAHTSDDAGGDDSKTIAELRRKVRFWKNIHAWEPAEQMAYYFCGPVKPADWTEAIFVRAQKHRDAIKLLSWEARHSMSRLLTLAEMGNEDAVREAVDTLERFVRLLNLYAKISPEVFRKVAKQLQSWPVVYSSHPRLNQIPKKISAQIMLGQGIYFEFSPNTKWNPNDKGCKIAIHLYEHIKMMRRYPESNELSPCFDAAIKLPDIKQAKAVSAWWGVAKNVLLTGYPTPEEDEELRSLTKIKNRSKVRDKILECIENRFFSLFPKRSR